QARFWMRKACGDGREKTARFFVDLLVGHGEPEDLAEAFSLAERLASEGHPFAYAMLGRMYADGTGVEKDFTEAVRWMRMAAGEDPSYELTLADLLFDGGGSEDVAESAMLYMWHDDVPHAMGRLGRMYRDGIGVGRDPVKAERYIRSAVDAGVSNSRLDLLDLLYSRDDEASLSEFHEKARMYAASGSKAASERLGRAYRDGRGVGRDLSEAAGFMRVAAKGGPPRAKGELLGILWSMGTDESLREMVTLAKGYAESGNAKAMGYLGRAYRDGKGVPQNLDTASYWLERSAEGGVAWAGRELEALRNGEFHD
ncbi:MAG: sel1 repeat family protein, partial [Candidatus Methanomethylophilaceae archaeon]|nr:sel1 repeat family protein [Candidatus Methanomethylophilaceae archaeon]